MSTLNLIDALTCYLVLAFVVGTVIQVRNYRAMLGVIFTFSHRWPKLLILAKQYRVVFLRWPTLLPVGLTFALMVSNTLAGHLLWYQASVTPADVAGCWP